MRTGFHRTRSTNADIRTSNKQFNVQHGHGSKLPTGGQRHPNAVTRNPHDNLFPEHSVPITTTETNYNQRGSRKQTEFSKHSQHSFAEPLPKVGGPPGNRHKTTHTIPHTGHKNRQHTWIPTRYNHIHTNDNHTNGSKSHTNGIYTSVSNGTGQ